MEYTFTMTIKVQDPQKLYEAALRHAQDVDGLDYTGAIDVLLTDGKIDVGACITTLLDPGAIKGCEILGSEAQRN